MELKEEMKKRKIERQKEKLAQYYDAKGGGVGTGGGETRRRAIVKAITYRVIVAITLAAISWFYTGNLFETSAVSITYTIIATVVYYVHERAWLKVTWGKVFHHSKKDTRQ